MTNKRPIKQHTSQKRSTDLFQMSEEQLLGLFAEWALEETDDIKDRPQKIEAKDVISRNNYKEHDSVEIFVQFLEFKSKSDILNLQAGKMLDYKFVLKQKIED